MIDWADTELSTTVTVYQVDPHDLTSVLATLDYTALEVSYGYYTDTRASAKVTTHDADSLLDGAWLRVVLSVDGTDWKKTLFTGFVSGMDEEHAHDAVETSLELSSSLKAVESDALTSLLCVGAGATAKAAITSLLDRTGLPWRFAPGSGDYRFTSTRLYDPGESLLSTVFDLASTASLRVDVDGDGTVVLSQYSAPSATSPKLVIDSDDPRSVVLSESVSHSSDRFSRANRSIVTWKDEDDRFVTGYADLDGRSALSFARRGVRIAEVHELQDMPEPRSVAHAQQLARAYLAQDSDSSEEYSLTVIWSGDVDCGDVVLFRPSGGEAVKALVASVDSDPLSMRMDLTLREVGNGD